MTLRKYLVLAGVTVFAAAGDSMLSHGMKQAGSVSLHHLSSLFVALLNPWVAVGILLLLAFFASYMNALSWADLTYVLPATSLGYVLLALVAKFALHEQVSPLRWLGIALISGGVDSGAGHPEESEFCVGRGGDGRRVFQPAVCLVLGRCQPGRARGRFANIHRQRLCRANFPARARGSAALGPEDIVATSWPPSKEPPWTKKSIWAADERG